VESSPVDDALSTRLSREFDAGLGQSVVTCGFGLRADSRQPTVTAFLIFHVSDESNLDRWQSGLFYADDTPKSSLPVVQRAIQLLRSGGAHACSTAGIQRFTARSIAGP
jgi:hypothetical protein